MVNEKINKKAVIIMLVSLLGVAIIVGVVLSMGKIRTFLGGATGGLRPEGVRVTNITANSATVIWQTSKPVAGQVEYGTTPGSFLLRNTETAQIGDHSLALSPLLPETIYYFRIRIGEEIYDENGAPYSFTTKGAVASVPRVTVSPTPTLPVSTSSASVTKAPSATVSAKYKLNDFQIKFGSSDPEFDINKDGVVNSADWILYQEK